MLNNPGAGGNQPGQRIPEGTHVLDANGNKVGQVGMFDAQGGYLVVHKGLIFRKDIYIPMQAIRSISQDGVHLNATKDELSSGRWDQPPPPTRQSGAVGETTYSTTREPGAVSDTAYSAAREPTERVEEGEGLRVPLHEEELIAGKREVERGRVHVDKDVTEQEQTVSMPVTHEEVHVEHTPVAGRPVEPGEGAFQEREFDIPVTDEEMVTGKRAQVTDEVRIEKQPVTEEQQATDTVRKERLRIEHMDEQGRVIGHEGEALGQYEEEPPPERSI